MRGASPEVGSPYTLAQQLPEVYQEDDLVRRLTSAWDEVLAPVISTLDCLDAYVDPWTAPPDFVAWLAERLGAPAGDWPVERQRVMAAEAMRLHARRGCPDALRAWLSHTTGGRVDVFDGGGVYTSAVPDSAFAESCREGVRIRVTVPAEPWPDVKEIEAVASACLPAQLAWRLEVVTE